MSPASVKMLQSNKPINSLLLSSDDVVNSFNNLRILEILIKALYSSKLFMIHGKYQMPMIDMYVTANNETIHSTRG